MILIGQLGMSDGNQSTSHSTPTKGPTCITVGV